MNLIYNRFKANLFNKECDMEGDTFKVALMATAHSGSTASDSVWADISANEISGTGYTANGESLTGGEVTEGEATKFDGVDTAWIDASFTAYYAVLYDNTLASDDLVCSFDFGSAKTVSEGTFTIVWSSDGILTLSG